jgi:uncharacterized membrane protein YciS (DUF1049 family)
MVTKICNSQINRQQKARQAYTTNYLLANTLYSLTALIRIGLCLALGLVCLCGTDLMGLDRWDWTSGTG